jgi:hypothetical protein
MIDHDPNPFADCDFIVFYGGAKLTDRHLACIIHCVNEEVIEWLERREQRKRGRRRSSGGKQGECYTFGTPPRVLP